jgi:hypothetical protein
MVLRNDDDDDIHDHEFMLLAVICNFVCFESCLND